MKALLTHRKAVVARCAYRIENMGAAMTACNAGDDPQRLALVDPPTNEGLARGMQQVRENIPDKSLRARTVCVVSELAANLHDHNRPRGGTVSVYEDKEHDGVLVVSEGVTTPRDVDYLAHRIRSLRDPHHDAAPIPDRLNTRIKDSREGGRGLYWIASNAAMIGGRPAIDMEQIQQSDGRVKFAISARIGRFKTS